MSTGRYLWFREKSHSDTTQEKQLGKNINYKPETHRNTQWNSISALKEWVFRRVYILGEIEGEESLELNGYAYSTRP